MQIIRGLFDNMVLQRNKQNLCEAEFSLVCSKNGSLKVSVTASGKELSNYSIDKYKSKSKYELNACLKGLPTGGPYNIMLSINNDAGKSLESLSVKNILVGDVWILAGQSNMQGIGYIKYTLEPHPMTRAFYMNDQWDTAKDPLHVLYNAYDKVHTEVLGAVKDAPHIGVGPGVSFSQEMHRLTGVPQGIIACAHGGTSMSQWDPKLKELEGKSLYGAMYRRFIKNGGKVAGILWYQGCSEADENSAPVYTSRMIELIKSIRKDFKSSALPVVAVQISRVCLSDTWKSDHWNSIQEQQRKLPASIKSFSVVPAIDLALDDLIHISGYDQNRLGKRLAHAMSVLTDASTSFMPPIKLKNIKTEVDKFNKCINIIISYENVMGNLESLGRPSGFSLINKYSAQNDLTLYRIDLLENTVILKTSIDSNKLLNHDLYYGFGLDPYCNITDSHDRSLPVMGPIWVGMPSKM